MSEQCNQLPSWLAGPARRTTLRFSNLFQSGVDVLMRRLAILGFLAALAVTAAGSLAAQEIEDFYQTAVVPRAKAHGQEPPTLDAARDYIQEALVQRGINEQAEKWLKESRTRLHIEKLFDEAAK